MCIGTVISNTVFSISQISFNTVLFCRTIIYKDDELNGLMLVIDTSADTVCEGKHEFAEQFFIGKFITARDFTVDLGSLDNIPIAFFCMIMMHKMVKQ